MKRGASAGPAGRRSGSRQDVRDARGGPATAGKGSDVVDGSSRRTGAPRHGCRRGVAGRATPAGRPSRGRRSANSTWMRSLARKPDIALVDELAHTNAPGSRNQKRWQDVEAMLARRHRRDLDGEHPAHRIAQRCRGEDHRCYAAGDDSHSVVRSADQIEVVDLAPQSLQAASPTAWCTRPASGRRAVELFPPRQPDGAAGTGAPLAGRRGRQRPQRATAPSRASRARGRRESGSSSRSPAAPRARP